MLQIYLFFQVKKKRFVLNLKMADHNDIFSVLNLFVKKYVCGV